MARVDSMDHRYAWRDFYCIVIVKIIMAAIYWIPNIALETFHTESHFEKCTCHNCTSWWIFTDRAQLRKQHLDTKKNKQTLFAVLRSSSLFFSSSIHQGYIWYNNSTMSVLLFPVQLKFKEVKEIIERASDPVFSLYYIDSLFNNTYQPFVQYISCGPSHHKPDSSLSVNGLTIQAAEQLMYKVNILFSHSQAFLPPTQSTHEPYLCFL